MKIFMTVVIVVIVAGLLVSLTGCSGQARTDYYQAVAISSVSHANIQAARYQALSDIASGSGSDASSRTAAVMAIAMLRETTIQPRYVEDETLSWAKALAGPLTGVAALLIQADLSSDTNKQNNKTQRAAIDARTTQQGQLVDALSIEDSGGATADLAIVGLIDIAGQSIDSAVDSSGNAIDGMETVSVTAITETGNIADNAITGVVDVAGEGFDTIEVISIDDNLTTLGIVDILQPVVITP